MTEARSGADEHCCPERLADAAAVAAPSGQVAAELLRRLVRAVLAHVAGRLRDDATALLHRRASPDSG